jgi:HEXXH motif-containing protein
VTPRLDEPWRLPGLDVSVAAAPRIADWLWSRVSPPSPEIAAHVEPGGLQIASVHSVDRALFEKAAKAIAWAPSLAAVAATRVGAIHLLRAEPGYDVSHSEPRWPDRIFVSVPDRPDEVGVLRLAESVVHEALHLHLTELETICPLVRDAAGTLPSPWRLEPRGYGGVLHGAFVFVGLKAYFDIVTEPSESRAGRHLDQRRGQIAQELAQVDPAALALGLTDAGAELIARLFARDATAVG